MVGKQDWGATMKMKSNLFYSSKQLRLFTIDKLLRRSGGATREQITTAVIQTGVSYSRATFVRDIEHLEGVLGAHISKVWRFDAAKNGPQYFYELADKTWTMGKVALKPSDLVALFVAKDMVAKYWGLPIADELQHVIDHLGKELPDFYTVHADQLAPIAFGPDSRQVSKASPTVWKNVLQATTERRKLEITYAKGWGPSPGDRPKPETRVIHPYHIVNLCGTWYLLGSHSETDAKVRQFHVDRIQAAKALKATFQIPPDFNVDALLDTSFGRFIGDPDDVVDVRLRFSKQVTPLVLNREFQPYQTAKRLPDGRAELKLQVSRAGPWPLYHVLGWVLSWGADVEVLEPESLREQVRRAATATAAQYSRPREGG